MSQMFKQRQHELNEYSNAFIVLVSRTVSRDEKTILLIFFSLQMRLFEGHFFDTESDI